MNVAVTAAPGVGDVIGQDDFARTVGSGWGTADAGGTWTVAGTGFTVASSEGQVAVPAGSDPPGAPGCGHGRRGAHRARVGRSDLPVGGNLNGYILARANATNAYRGAIRVATSGNVFVSLKKVLDGVESNVAAEVATGIVLAPGSNLRFRFEVVGNDLKLKVWEGGTTEPDAWHVTATDGSLGISAAVGFAAYTGGAVSNGPITWSFDDYTVKRGS